MGRPTLYLDEPFKIDGRRYTRNAFKLVGFCLRAEWALEHRPTGRIHFADAKEFTMTECGLNTRSRPIPLTLRRRRFVTCLRCLTVGLLALRRQGKL